LFNNFNNFNKTFDYLLILEMMVWWLW